MDTYDRNVAIVGTSVHGGILLLGMFLFALGHRGEPFYTHPSSSVAVFSVFWFAFSPSLLFIGGTVPWLCALCGSRPAALVFAIVPGSLFVLVCAYLVMVKDKYQSFSSAFDRPRVSPWGRQLVSDAAYPAGAPTAAGVVPPYYYEVEHFPSPAAVAEMRQRGTGPFSVVPPYAAGVTDFTSLSAQPDAVVGPRRWLAYPPQSPTPPPLLLAPGLPPSVARPIYGPGPSSLPPGISGWRTSATATAMPMTRDGTRAFTENPRTAFVESPPPPLPHGQRPNTYYIA